MKNGDVYSDAQYRWYERLWPLLGKTYFTHAWGTLYVVSGRAATALASMPNGTLRFFTNEGTRWSDLTSSCHASMKAAWLRKRSCDHGRCHDWGLDAGLQRDTSG
jgi:hypothetical protein